MTNWKEYKLSDLMQIKYGKDHKHLADGSYPLYGSGGIMRYVEKPLYEEESILIPRKGTLSNLFYLNEPFWSVDTMFYSQINKELALPKYLYYTLKTFDLASLNVGSAVPSLTTQVLNEVLVSVPDLPTQTAIAEILSSLDDKIELNNKINQELENLAQTLFKQWFIDFEFPNENGKPYKSSGGEMVDSELGEIPKGWEVKMVTDFIEVKDGTHDSPKQCEEGNYLITSKHLKNSFIDFDSAYKISNEDFVNVNKRSKVDKNDILITMIGTVGNLYYVGNEPNYAIKNIGLFKSSTSESFSIYLYEYLKSSFISEYYRVRLAGSTQQYLTLKVLRETPIIYNENIVSAFVDAIKEMRNTVINNSNENQELTNLRDTLLPKLISGELEVADIMAEKA
jgi:type I restriction enzyme S subunit